MTDEDHSRDSQSGDIDGPSGATAAVDTSDRDEASETVDDSVQSTTDLLERLRERIAEESESIDRDRAIEELSSVIDSVESLGVRCDELESNVDDLESSLAETERELEEKVQRIKRTQADFQNYKKRKNREMEQMKTRATEDFISRILTVRDNLKRAIDQESDDLESLREGVDITLKEFDRILSEENVEEIDPDPGSEVDPNAHEVMMTVDSDHPEGTVADVYTPGYRMGEKVVQNAQVTVSNGNEDADDASTDEDRKDA